MWIVAGSLSELETLVYGYYAGLDNHGLIELVPEMTRHFSTWLSHETGWSTSCGWAHAITSNRTDSTDSSPLDEFFDISTWLTAVVGAILLLVIFGVVVDRGGHGRTLRT